MKVMSRGVLWGLGSAIGTGILVYSEYDIATLPFVLAVFAVLVSALLVASGRLAFSTITTWALLGIVTAISAVKMRYMGIGLHAFDAYFYLFRQDLEAAALLGQNYLLPIVACIGLLLAGIFACCVAWSREIANSRHRIVACVVLLPSLAVWNVLLPNAGDKNNEHRYYTAGHRTSSFFLSFKDARYLFAPTPLAARLAAMPTHAAYDGVVDCTAVKSRPDVILVLMESAVRPSLFPEIKAPPALDASYESADRSTAGLRVETWGGGTWITTTGLMTSLPTTEFGWMRPYLPAYLQGRVHHSLPQLFKSCGYQTAVISPLSYPFLNEGPFLTALGFDDYLDFKTIKAPSRHERDRFYFGAALDYVAHHREHDGRPLFLYVMTMAAHGPYSFRFDPDMKLAGEPFGNDPETDEYLRRLTMQRQDFADFTDKLEKLPSRNGILVADFGDHQPSVTRSLAEGVSGPEALGTWSSIGYRTYYSISPIHMALTRPLPKFPALDLVYLAPTLFELSGLPIDDVYRGLLTLRDECRGTFVACPERQRVESHLKKLANGGLLQFEQAAPVSPAPKVAAFGQ